MIKYFSNIFGYSLCLLANSITNFVISLFCSLGFLSCLHFLYSNAYIITIFYHLLFLIIQSIILSTCFFFLNALSILNIIMFICSSHAAIHSTHLCYFVAYLFMPLMSGFMFQVSISKF